MMVFENHGDHRHHADLAGMRTMGRESVGSTWGRGA